MPSVLTCWPLKKRLSRNAQPLIANSTAVAASPAAVNPWEANRDGRNNGAGERCSTSAKATRLAAATTNAPVVIGALQPVEPAEMTANVSAAMPADPVTWPGTSSRRPSGADDSPERASPNTAVTNASTPIGANVHCHAAYPVIADAMNGPPPRPTTTAAAHSGMARGRAAIRASVADITRPPPTPATACPTHSSRMVVAAPATTSSIVPTTVRPRPSTATRRRPYRSPSTPADGGRTPPVAQPRSRSGDRVERLAQVLRVEAAHRDPAQAPPVLALG